MIARQLARLPQYRHTQNATNSAPFHATVEREKRLTHGLSVFATPPYRS
jgi:hypothetical protein